MQEQQVREIHEAEDLSGYTHEQLRDADKWVKDYALAQLRAHLRSASITDAMVEYITLMARCHYGSVETDEMLKAHQCYPSWLKVED